MSKTLRSNFITYGIVIAAYVMTRCANAEGEGENGTQSEAGSSGEISAQGGEGPSRLPS